MLLSQAVDPGKESVLIVYERVQYVCVYANMCAKRGVVVLRSMHTCGCNTFFRPHRREVALVRGRGHPSSTLWLHPCECVYVCVCVCVDVMYLYVSGLCVCV